VTAREVLKARYGAELAGAIVTSFVEIETNFGLGKWKASEIDAGHFVEAIRRVLEQELFGSSTPLGSKLEHFTDQVLLRYENAKGDESYRMLVPRVLKAVYNIRSKRGAGHLAGVSPNEMDSALVFNSCKWVLAEVVRLASGLSVEKTQALVDAITERKVHLLWKHEGTVRVLDPEMAARDQVLVLLYDRSPQTDVGLAGAVEYSRMSNFRTLLRALHKKRLIEFGKDGRCVITPLGVAQAEDLLK
jgi:hypothetical protein